MVRRSAMRWTLAILALTGAKTAWAAQSQIQFTGNVEKDFPTGQPRIGIILDNPNTTTHLSNPNDVAQAGFITQAGHTSGWNIKDLRTHYDSATDTLAVGLNFFGIAGDADGDGDPGHTATQTAVAGGMDLPHLGGRESIAV